MITRRKFVTISSLAAALPAAFACGSDDDENGESCNGVGSTSSDVAGHSHSVCVPTSDLGGSATVAMLYTTSSNTGHTHQITLTPEQLGTLAGGGTVAVTTTVDDGHTHDFTLDG